MKMDREMGYFWDECPFDSPSATHQPTRQGDVFMVLGMNCQDYRTYYRVIGRMGVGWIYRGGLSQL